MSIYAYIHHLYCNKFRKLILISRCLFLLPLVLSCAATESNIRQNQLPSPPLDKTRSVIAINLIDRAPVRIFKTIPNTIYFIKLRNDHDIKSGMVIASNYKVGDTFYLVNANPGTYYILGSYFANSYHEEWSIEEVNPDTDEYEETQYVSDGLHESFTFLNDESIQATKIIVKPASFVYAGEYSINLSMFSSKSDELRSMYRSILERIKNEPLRGNEYTGSINEQSKDAQRENMSKNIFMTHFRGWQHIFH